MCHQLVYWWRPQQHSVCSSPCQYWRQTMMHLLTSFFNHTVPCQVRNYILLTYVTEKYLQQASEKFDVLGVFPLKLLGVFSFVSLEVFCHASSFTYPRLPQPFHWASLVHTQCNSGLFNHYLILS